MGLYLQVNTLLVIYKSRYYCMNVFKIRKTLLSKSILIYPQQKRSICVAGFGTTKVHCFRDQSHLYLTRTDLGCVCGEGVCGG